jgi:hypothetical protein
MNTTTSSPSLADSQALTRREAIKRAALMLGVAITPSLLTGVMQAQTAPAAGSKAVYLTAQQSELAGAIAERILPRTDTPGALDVGVPAFIDLMYGKFMSAAEKTALVAGLAGVDASARKANQQAFTTLSAAQQDGVLKQIAEFGEKNEKAFFHQIKELTVLGYFTSETVGKTVLHYDPVPGRFDGCVPLSEVGNKAWNK